MQSHLFNRIIRHAQRRRPADNVDNFEYGEYWQRHRDIDNAISSAFMFLPEMFRLPENRRNPAAVYANLNLHASVICLHLTAIEQIDAHALPDHARELSRNRISTAAREIVRIMKLTDTRGQTPVSSVRRVYPESFCATRPPCPT